MNRLKKTRETAFDAKKESLTFIPEPVVPKSMPTIRSKSSEAMWTAGKVRNLGIEGI